MMATLINSLQLSNENGGERLLYFDQNSAILDVFLEKTLSLADIGTINFQINNPPKSLEVDGESYRLSDYKTGTKFIIGVAENIEVEEWIYISKDKKTNIRVINNKGVIHYNKGTKLQKSNFEDTLNLNRPPIQNIEYERPAGKTKISFDF